MAPNVPTGEPAPESPKGIPAMLLELPKGTQAPKLAKHLCLTSGYWGKSEGHGGFWLRAGKKADSNYGCWETGEQ